MILEINGFALDLSLQAIRHGHWITLPIGVEHFGVYATLTFDDKLSQRWSYSLCWTSKFPTRLRLHLALLDQTDLFHLIPGNIHGDNNAAHVRPGEFPCLTNSRPAEKNCASLWEFRADRASHPVSILCCANGAVGVSIDPYTDDIRNGLFAALPNVFGVSSGYGNDPLTFVEKTNFTAATSDLSLGASVQGMVYAHRGAGRRAAHEILREEYI